LTSKHNDEVNFFRNYKSIESLLSTKLWLYSILNSADWDGVKEIIDETNYTGSFEMADKARDKHPGPLSHKLISEKYFQKFTELNFAGRLWQNHAIK
jgi:hypothetical protein